MNKQLLLTLLLIFAVLFSISAVSASDVNVTDSHAADLVDDTTDVSVPMEKTSDSSVLSVSSDSNVDNDSSKVSLSSKEVLGSENSNTLSTNSGSNSLNDDGVSLDDGNTLLSSTIDVNDLTADNGKTETRILWKSPTKFYEGTQTMNVALKTADGTPISKKTISLTANGKTYSATTNADGLATFVTYLPFGTSSVVYRFDGSNDAKYASRGGTVSVNVVDKKKTETRILWKSATKFYEGTQTFNVALKTADGVAVANKVITLTANGKSYVATTNADGLATFVTYLPYGTSSVVYRFDGSTDDKYSSRGGTTSVNVVNKKKTETRILWKSATQFNEGTQTINIALKTADGVAVAKKAITLTANGKTYSATTNADGLATFVTYLPVGTSSVVYRFDGSADEKYSSRGGTTSVKVVNKKKTETRILWKSATKFYEGTQTINVALKTADGVAVAKKVITLTANGKTYSATTNADGLATFTTYLPVGTSSVVYRFDGSSDDKYSSRGGTVSVNVVNKKKTETRILWKSDTKFNQGSQTIKVALKTADGVAVAKKVITLTVNGKTYSATTNSNGFATFTTKLSAGTYSVVYRFDGAADDKYSSRGGTTSIKVVEKKKSETRILWKSETKFTEGSQTFKVALKTPSGDPIAKKVITLTVNGKSYTATTNANGIATFTVSLSAGTYTVKYNFDGTKDADYIGRTGSVSITVSKKATTKYGFGYWVFGGDMKSVNLNSLASQGTTDIFLNYYAITKHGQSAVESWIASANKVGINVHIWMQAFYDGSWINPVSGGSPNTAYFTKKINEAKKYAQMKGVAGVHFDYLRYPGTAYKTSGGTAAITQFVKEAVSAIHAVNPNCIVSCALMPETTNNVYYYGQDFAQISKYMDLVVPMIYKGNYGQSSSWITSTSKWFASNSNGAMVWAGLQGYKSDDDVSKLSPASITADSQAALDGKATGVIIFRWGVTNFVDFNSLSKSTSSGVTIAQIASAAYSVVSNLKSADSIPSKVSVGGNSYTAAQFLYLMTKATEYIDAGKSVSTTISPVSANAAENPSGITSKSSLSKANYLDVAKRVSSFIVSYGQAPNYASSAVGNIKYQALFTLFACVLAEYDYNGKLPTSMAVNSVVKPKESTPDPEPSPDVKSISIKNIIAGAQTVKTYYANNGKLPTSVTAGGVTFTAQEFLYLMSKAINHIGNSSNAAVPIISGVKAPASPSGDYIDDAHLVEDKYLRVAYLVSHYIEVKKQAPDYISTTIGNIIYSELADAFARILVFYDSNSNTLPTYVSIRYSDGSPAPIPVSGTGLNEKNKITNLEPYLKSTTNCQVNNTKIKAVVDSLIKGLTTDQEKAIAIYNYVRDQISYSFYYDTRYGAVGTLNAKTGNCVDQAHLVVAMARTAGLPARYVHGTCHFSSGSTYGHVWAQILVDDMWVLSDPTSGRNSFGKVLNWNTNSFTLHSISASISF